MFTALYVNPCCDQPYTCLPLVSHRPQFNLMLVHFLARFPDFFAERLTASWLMPQLIKSCNLSLGSVTQSEMLPNVLLFETYSHPCI